MWVVIIIAKVIGTKLIDAKHKIETLQYWHKIYALA